MIIKYQMHYGDDMPSIAISVVDGSVNSINRFTNQVYLKAFVK